MKQSLYCELVRVNSVTSAVFNMDFAWKGAAPRAGQFFMIKPKRSSVFLGRPISAALWKPAPGIVNFLVAVQGTGTKELAEMCVGEEAELTGPLGNAWADFLPAKDCDAKPVALVGGGVGIAPLKALSAELPGYGFDFYAGFREDFQDAEEKCALLGTVPHEVRNIIIAAENSKEGRKGVITDFLEPEKYRAIFACGPQPMLKAAADRCKAVGVPCFISLERRMACGVGACLGCAVSTVSSKRHCCTDGPIFPAGEIVFDEQ